MSRLIAARLSGDDQDSARILAEEMVDYLYVGRRVAILNEMFAADDTLANDSGVGSNEAARKVFIQGLRDLFDDRNKIAHSSKIAEVDRDGVKGFELLSAKHGKYRDPFYSKEMREGLMIRALKALTVFEYADRCLARYAMGPDMNRTQLEHCKESHQDQH